MTARALALLMSVAVAAPAIAQVEAPSPRVTDPEPDRKGDRLGAEETLPAPPEADGDRATARLDLLFDRLAQSSDQSRADRIARQILRRLNESGSDTIDLLMARAGVAMQTQQLGLALDLLDGVVRLRPEFAEGWNRRATVYFLQGDYGPSLGDIEQVLRREPRHWGALVGLAMILVALDRKAEALAAMDRALAVHPFLEEMKTRREQLAQELGGADI